MKLIFDQTENIAGKGENAGNHQSSPCFQPYQKCFIIRAIYNQSLETLMWHLSRKPL